MISKDEDIDFEEQCIHLEECKLSSRVLFYLDECNRCEVAEKFRLSNVD